MRGWLGFLNLEDQKNIWQEYLGEPPTSFKGSREQKKRMGQGPIVPLRGMPYMTKNIFGLGSSPPKSTRDWGQTLNMQTLGRRLPKP